MAKSETPAFMTSPGEVARAVARSAGVEGPDFKYRCAKMRPKPVDGGTFG
jgi:hypothetical protein